MAEYPGPRWHSSWQLGLPKDPPHIHCTREKAASLLTVGAGFLLYHNGQLIRANTDKPVWWTATAVYVKLDPDSDDFAIQAQNCPSGTNLNGTSLAGLRASIQISYADGTTTTISSDDTWRVTQPIPGGFQSLSFNDTQ